MYDILNDLNYEYISKTAWRFNFLDNSEKMGLRIYTKNAILLKYHDEDESVIVPFSSITHIKLKKTEIIIHTISEF